MGRVQSLVARANRKVNIKAAATLLASSTLISALLGFLRDRWINGLYMDTYDVGLQAYQYAFTVPDFMFFILVSGALSVSFIPVFNQRLASGNKRSAWELSTSLINFMAIVTLITSILIIIFAEPLLKYVIAPGLSETGLDLATSMMRVIAINPFLFSIAAVIASIQQAVGRFTFYTLAPLLYNVGIIIGALFFTQGINIFGWQVFDGGIMGVALGVALGSVLQLIVSLIGLAGLGFDYEFKIFWKNKGFRRVLRLLPARSVDQAMDYIVGLVEGNLLSHMSDKAMRAFSQAMTLHSMPINLVGVAISNAAFPKLTERVAQGRPDLFKKELQTILRVIIWLILPIAVVMFFTRGYVVSFIKPGGDELMAGILGSLIIAIVFRSIYHIAARGFYAQQDTKTPLIISIFSISLNIGLALWFTLSLQLGPYGLAWAQSIVAVVEVVILFAALSVRIKGLIDPSVVQGIIRMAATAGLMAIITYLLVVWMPYGGQQSITVALPRFALISGVSFIAYIVIGKFMKLPEVDPVISRVRSILFGRVAK